MRVFLRARELSVPVDLLRMGLSSAWRLHIEFEIPSTVRLFIRLENVTHFVYFIYSDSFTLLANAPCLRVSNHLLGDCQAFATSYCFVRQLDSFDFSRF